MPMNEMTLEYPEKIREQTVDGLGPWYWPLNDDGAWDGPVKDWEDSHKEIIMGLENHRMVIQAGGNCGLYPALLSQIFENVLTFEPSEDNYHFLMKNCAKYSNIQAGMYAVGLEEKLVTMLRHDPTNVGMHTVNDSVPGETQMIVIDNQEYENVDLIWFDIEGYEIMALAGSLKTIEKHKPMVGIERPSPSVYIMLADIGYRFHARSEMDVFFKYKGFRA